MALEDTIEGIFDSCADKVRDLLHPGQIDFFASVRQGDLAAVAAFVEKTPRAVKWRQGHGMTPLHAACHSGHKDVALYLLDKGAKLEAWTKGHWSTPLLTAIVAGHDDLALALVGRGAKLRPRIGSDLTLVDYAAWHGLPGILKELLSRGLPLNTAHDPLCGAARTGHTEIVRYLHEERGLPLDAPNKYGYLPVVEAASCGQLETLQYMLDRGVNYDAADKLGQRADATARACKHSEAADLIDARRHHDAVKLMSSGLPAAVTMKKLRLMPKPR